MLRILRLLCIDDHSLRSWLGNGFRQCPLSRWMGPLFAAAALFGADIPRMDIALFGTALRDGAGVEWSEERDIREIRIRYASAAARGLKVE